ncbi:MAG TPA: DUF2130 domain-containing protein [Polyangiaceae bacterium]|nr:DUF2130 domain-containing protein [Polyangiaceae bacterium]
MTLSRLVPEQHLHAAENQCPVCDQPITPEQFRVIQGRIRAEEQEMAARLETGLRAKLAIELAEVRAEGDRQLAAARAETAAAKVAAEQREITARAEAKAATEAEFAPKVAEIEKARIAAEQLAAEQTAARERDAAARAEEQQAAAAREQKLRNDNQLALARAEHDATVKIAAAQEKAKNEAEAAMQGRLGELEAARAAAEALVAETTAACEKETNERAHERAAAAAKEQALIAEQKEALAAAEREHANKVAQVKEEARLAAEASANDKIAAAESAKAAAELQLEQEKSANQANLDRRLSEAREAMEKAKDDAVNAERAKSFEENAKIKEALQKATRQLEHMSSYELGEGAELDLYEELKAFFEDDNIKRVEKGTPGADIVHEVIHNGISCGKIVYDSKNHKAWRNDFVSKLRSDQIAEGADHAILSTSAFPSGKRQVHNVDGVIVANPARATALAEILRRLIVRLHEQRISNEKRDEKMAELYAYVTSEPCSQLLSSVETLAESLLALEVEEKKAHDKTWRKRGTILNKVLKAKGDLCFSLDKIIGTAEAEDAE